MNFKTYESSLSKLYGKTIGIVYTFEGESAAGYEHYEIWKSDVISSWMRAVEELQGLPLIIDARTFIQKAMNYTLPHLDYVINLNNGNKNISTLGLIPSVCAFLNIPCIPSNTIATVIGEQKHLSNIIVKELGINVPKSLSMNDTSGITRPIGLGSSLGVDRGITNNTFKQNYIYQEFIEGFDITTPILYNPLSETLEVLPAILYLPDTLDINWYLGEKEKALHKGYEKKVVTLAEYAKEKYLELAKTFGISCYCRIDARISCTSSIDVQELLNNPIALDNIYFLEINPMPTIKEGINFLTAMNGIFKNELIYQCFELYKKQVPNPTHMGFILSCSMYAFSTTTH